MNHRGGCFLSLLLFLILLIPRFLLFRGIRFGICRCFGIVRRGFGFSFCLDGFRMGFRSGFEEELTAAECAVEQMIGFEAPDEEIAEPDDTGSGKAGHGDKIGQHILRFALRDHMIEESADEHDGQGRQHEILFAQQPDASDEEPEEDDELPDDPLDELPEDPLPVGLEL